MNVNLHWPQITWLVYMFVNLLLYARDHGKPQTGNDNFWMAALVVCLSGALLYCGGFFNGCAP